MCDVGAAGGPLTMTTLETTPTTQRGGNRLWKVLMICGNSALIATAVLAVLTFFAIAPGLVTYHLP